MAITIPTENPNEVHGLDQFQQLAEATAVYRNMYPVIKRDGLTPSTIQDIENATTDAVKHRLLYAVLGLVGEAGEIANKLKKVLRGDKKLTGDSRQERIDELGDVLWYVAAIATDEGIDLSEVAKRNICKLYDRTRRGTVRGDGDKR